jgi:hypothetical protein
MSGYSTDGGGIMGSGRLLRQVACWLVAATVLVIVFAPRPAAAVPWVQRAKLLAADGASGDAFGNCVAVSGTTAVIGAQCHLQKPTAIGSSPPKTSRVPIAGQEASEQGAALATGM